MSTPFLRVRPWSFVTCLMCPCRAFYECFCFCFWLYSPKMWGLLRLKYPKKSKTQMSDEKTRKAKKKHSLKPRQGHTKHMCKISGSTSQKRRGHWHLKEFWVLCLNQPVGRIQKYRSRRGHDTNVVKCGRCCWSISFLSSNALLLITVITMTRQYYSTLCWPWR